MSWNERDFVARDEAERNEREAPDQWERYRFAARWITKGQRVLDVACGSGYGTRLLSETSGRRALGLDIAPEAIGWAEKQFGAFADYALSSAERVAQLQGAFDVVVSLETLEHMDQAAGRKFLLDLKSMLRPQGLIVLSTPLSDGPARFAPANPFHVREYTWDELGEMMGAHFQIRERFTQVSRLGRLRELLSFGRPPSTSSPAAAPAAPVTPTPAAVRPAAGWRGRILEHMRHSPFWRRGTFVARRGFFGGVQVVVGVRGT
jgi:SAM-dependent methyltransferase